MKRKVDEKRQKQKEKLKKEREKWQKVSLINKMLELHVMYMYVMLHICKVTCVNNVYVKSNLHKICKRTYMLCYICKIT